MCIAIMRPAAPKLFVRLHSVIAYIGVGTRALSFCIVLQGEI
jgi:hypothetical protein